MIDDKKQQIILQNESMQELQTKLDVIEIRKKLGQDPVDADEDQPEKPIMPMSIFGMSGPMSLPMSMNNIAQ